jgi:hypothetical protein
MEDIYMRKFIVIVQGTKFELDVQEERHVPFIYLEPKAISKNWADTGIYKAAMPMK